MKMRNLLFLVTVLTLPAIFSACSNNSAEMKNGYYSAEAANFDAHGWKEYISIYVSDNRIVTVEYNARNSSGFVKSWDMDYMRTMMATNGTYPNEYTRSYAVSLLNWQNPENVDAITGATHSHTSFQLLAQAAIDHAKAGDKQAALVEILEENEE